MRDEHRAKQERVPASNAHASVAPVSGTTQLSNPIIPSRPSGVVPSTASASIPPSTDDIDSDWTSDEESKPAPAATLRATPVPRAPAVPADLREPSVPSSAAPFELSLKVSQTISIDQVEAASQVPTQVSPAAEVWQVPSVVQPEPEEPAASVEIAQPQPVAPTLPLAKTLPSAVDVAAVKSASTAKQKPNTAAEISEAPRVSKVADDARESVPNVPMKSRAGLWISALLVAAAAAGGLWYNSERAKHAEAARAQVVAQLPTTPNLDPAALKAAARLSQELQAGQAEAKPEPAPANTVTEPTPAPTAAPKTAESPPVDTAASATPPAAADSASAQAAADESATPAPDGEKIKVLLKVRPPDARVFRKGKEVGKPPLTIELAPGERQAFEVGRDGYTTRKVVLDGSKTEVSVGLNPIQ